MDYGKIYRVGNYYMVKLTKSLSRKEQESLRSWIPEELKKGLSRRGLPYIKVSTVSGSWSVEFSVVERMFNAFDTATEEELSDKTTLNMLSNLFSGMYVDTTLMGDKSYNEAKGKALSSLMKRLSKMKSETAEEKAADDAILEKMKSEMEKSDVISRMAKEVDDGR